MSSGNPSVLAVHAHPDDESITMGGTLARYVAEGARVTLVTCTLGEEGEVIGPDLAGLVAGAADQLGGYRLWELRRACRALGITDQRLLGGVGAFRDSGMAGSPSAAHPNAFVRAGSGGPDHDRAVRELVRVIDEVRPQVVLTYDADGGYGHPDHITAHQVAMAAAAVSGVPRVLAVVRPESVAVGLLSDLVVPAGYLAAAPSDLGYLSGPDRPLLALAVGCYRAQRAAALAAHRTQVDLIDGGFALSNRIAQPLADQEFYAVLAGPALPPEAAEGRQPPGGDDLFAGL